MVATACGAAGVSRAAPYAERKKNELFAAQWQAVEDQSTDELEAEARRRAVDGSDTLLIFLLKARKPATYRENVKVEHSGPEGGPITYAHIPDEDSFHQATAQILAEAEAIKAQA